MHLRLVQFEGIHIALAPGWYELPSHMSSDDVRRLLDLLSHILPGVEDVVECQWRELGELTFGDATLAFVSVPDAITSEALSERLRSTPVHHGFYERETPGHWPELPWDEMQLKSKLAAALRKSITRPNHPLARLDIAKLPVDRLSEATSEPIELLVLAEGTVESATRQREIGQPIDWAQCVRWSIGNRLAKRLARADRRVVGRLREAIASSVEGLLRTLDWDREIDELVRLGLAHREQGDAMLVPLARMANEHGVVPILDIEGVTAPAIMQTPQRTRATTPEQAINAFDPAYVITLGDPWLVDLRPLVPALLEFGRTVIQSLSRRDRMVRVAVMQHAGSGGTTMLRRLFGDLAALGVDHVELRLDRRRDIEFVDLVLHMLSVSLQHGESISGSVFSPELLADLRAWLGEHALDGELRDYIRLRRETFEHKRVDSLVAIVRRVVELQGEQRDRIRSVLALRIDELLDYLVGVLDELRAPLAARSQILCLHIAGSEWLSAAQVESLFVAHARDLERLGCHVLFSVDPPLAYLLGETVVEYPALSGDAMYKSLREVLGVRANVEATFERDVEGSLKFCAKYANGSLRLGIELARGWVSALARGIPWGLSELIEYAMRNHDGEHRYLPTEWSIIASEFERREKAGEDMELSRARLTGSSDTWSGPVPFARLEGYRLLERVGDGPFAQVWRAWERQEARLVAIKILHPAWVGDRAWLARHREGLRALAKLDHPHVVRILREPAGHAEEMFYVMEWMSSGPLAAQLGRFNATGTSAPYEDVLIALSAEPQPTSGIEFLCDIGEAIDAIHRVGLLHGGITPYNMLFDEGWRLKLADFDLLCPSNAAAAPKLMKAFSPSYTAPERLQGRDFGPGADVYGFGATIVACLLGKDPPVFITHAQPGLLDELSCSDPLAQALRHALAHDVSDRAVDCSALLSALRGIADVPAVANGAATDASIAAIPDAPASENVPTKASKPVEVVAVIAAGVIGLIPLAVAVFFAYGVWDQGPGISTAVFLTFALVGYTVLFAVMLRCSD